MNRRNFLKSTTGLTVFGIAGLSLEGRAETKIPYIRCDPNSFWERDLMSRGPWERSPYYKQNGPTEILHPTAYSFALRTIYNHAVECYKQGVIGGVWVNKIFYSSYISRRNDYVFPPNEMAEWAKDGIPLFPKYHIRMDDGNMVHFRPSQDPSWNFPHFSTWQRNSDIVGKTYAYVTEDLLPEEGNDFSLWNPRP